MALTRDFRETVQARVRKDEKFRRGLLSDAVEALLAGEFARLQPHHMVRQRDRTAVFVSGSMGEVVIHARQLTLATVWLK